MNILELGTIVTCPRKGHKIATSNRLIRSGDMMKASDFDFEEGQEKLQGQRMHCEKILANGDICGSRYLVQGKLHTNVGWQPNDPILETVA